MKKVTLAQPEKNAITAILLCLLIFCIIPFGLVKVLPSVADSIAANPYLMMMPSVFIVLILAAYSGSFQIGKSDFSGIGFGKIFIYSISSMLLAGISAFCWLALLEILKISYNKSVPIEDFIASCSQMELIFVMPLICIIIPIAEEIIFRRVIFEGIRYRFPPVFSMSVTSFLFAALHGIFFQLFPLFVLGMCFQGFYMRQGKLGASIFAHCCNNTFAFLMLLLM